MAVTRVVVDLALLSSLVIAFAVLMYVVLDGFDLGIGVLFPFVRDARDQERMLASVAPLWDGNETWLVLGGAMLFAGFPAAYAMLFSAWHVPLLILLLALVFRGVAFEFRPRAQAKWIWGAAFSGGSIVAAFAQGVLLGSFIEGLPATPGERWIWLTPFAVMSGAGLVAGYALLGATWLIYKTDGDLQRWAYTQARRLGFAVVTFIGIVSLWTPYTEPAIAARWFTWPNVVWLAPLPIATLGCAVALDRALRHKHERAPFGLSVALFVFAYAGLAISIWPYAVPRLLTVWQAAAPPATQGFMLIGVALLLPLVLGYTLHTYRVFRGKTADIGYH